MQRGVEKTRGIRRRKNLKKRAFSALLVTALMLGAVPSGTLQAQAADSAKATESQNEGFLDKVGGFFTSLFGADENETSRAAGDRSIIADASSQDHFERYLTDADGNFSTENIGRIWTDKTVSEKDISLQPSSTSGEIKIEKGDSDFLVGLSALSSTSQIAGQAQVPLDTVFVLDFSGSMDEDMGNTTRYEAMVEAANSAIKTLMEANDNNRVAVVAFSGGTTTTLSSLAHYRAEDNHLRVDNGSFPFYTPTVEGKSASRQVTGGTNIHQGIYDGMNILASNQDTTVNIGGVEIQRIPAVVLLSDGAPTYSSSSASWWTPNGNSQQGPGGSSYAGNGFLPALTASYMKNRINTTYGTTEETATQIYTVGLGIDNLDTNDRNLARVTLDPTSNLNANNDMASTVRGYWNSYSSGNRVRVSINRNSTYTVTHPTGQAAQYDPDSLQYNDQYFSATNVDDLNDAFADIATSIVDSAPTVPIAGESGNGGAEGAYLTFTDELGSYMQVDQFKEIVFADEVFKMADKQTDGLTDTYTYSGTADNPNAIYPEGDLSDIIVKVERSDSAEQGDKVTVQVPVTMLPMRHFEVQKGEDDSYTMKVTEAFPIRIFYGVSLKDEAADNLRDPDETLKAYIENNSENGNVSFYSNAFTKGADNGDTSSTFRPAATNSFYFFTTDTKLYTDADCTIPARGNSLDPNRSYWYQREYYTAGKGAMGADGVKAELRTHQIELSPGESVLTDSDNLTQNEDGQWCIKAGSPRTQFVNNTVEQKENNGAGNTNTAKNIINPIWANDAAGDDYQYVDVLLGNNGKVNVELPGELVISKEIQVPDGVDKTDYRDTEFTFEIQLTSADSEVAGEYKTKIFDGQNVQEGNEGTITFDADGKAQTTLKYGQTLHIYGLSAGTEYTIEETKLPDGFTQKTPESNQPATGTIAAGAASEADFVNEYTFAEDAVLEGESALQVQKILDGRDWLDTDEFDFVLVSTDMETPMPENAKDSAVSDGKESVITVTDEEIAHFGDISYDTPGTYVYYIGERIPEERVPGITYSRALFKVTVTVKDNGNGTLGVESEMVQTDTDTGIDIPDGGTVITGNVARVTNTYNAASISTGPQGIKNYTDNSGGNPYRAGMFHFKVKAVGDNADSAPIPDGVTQGEDGYFTVAAAGNHSISFETATFTESMVGETFVYEISEVIPDDAVNEAGVTYADAVANGMESVSGTFTKDGMTYDGTVYHAQMEVSDEAVGGNGAQVKVTITYYRGAVTDNDIVQGNRVTFSNEYSVTPVTIDGNEAIHGTKRIDGRAWSADDSFTFELEKISFKSPTDTTAKTDEATLNAMPMPDVAEQTVTGEGTPSDTDVAFSFGGMTFTKPGTYVYKVSETKAKGNDLPQDGTDGMTYDRHETLVTVNVTDTNGALSAAVSYNNGTGSTVTDHAAFVNTYRASGTYGDIAGGLSVSKALFGRAMNEREFAFTITAKDGALAVPGNDAAFTNLHTHAAGAKCIMDGKLSNLRFTQADVGKTYTYTVAETAGTLLGVSYDQSQYEVAITIADNGDGTLSTVTTVTRVQDAQGNAVSETVGTYSSADGQTAEIPFANSYKADSVTVDTAADATLKKILTGRDWQAGDTFTFDVEKVSYNGSTEQTELDKMPAPTTPVVLDNKGGTKDGEEVDFGFGELTFTEAGTYRYRVTEEIPADAADGVKNGITYSENIATVIIRVTDNTQTGQLEAAVAVNSDTFENRYGVSVAYNEAVDLIVTKRLDGHAMAKDQFTFEIWAEDEVSAEKIGLEEDEPGIYTNSSAAADGETVEMHANQYPMTLTGADSGITYTYTFKEQAGTGGQGYTYDDTEYTVAITGTDNQDGTMTVKTVVTTTKAGEAPTEETYEWTSGQGTAAEEVRLPFVNQYSASGSLDGAAALAGTKKIEGPWEKDLSGFQFTLALDETQTDAALTGAVTLPEETTVTSDEDGKFVFGDITFTRPGTYYFTVKEEASNIAGMTDDTTEKTIRVDVTEADDGNGNGTLTAVVHDSSDALEFTNTYATTDSDALAVTIQKKVTGNAAEAGRFGFTMTAADDKTKQAIADGEIKADGLDVDGKSLTVSAPEIAEGATEDITFAGMTFTKTGEYKFIVTENMPADDNEATDGIQNAGWTYDEHEYEVTVKVTDNDSKLVAELVSDADDRVFTNSYVPVLPEDKKVDTDNQFRKVLSGRDWLESDTFIFTLTALDGGPMPEGTPEGSSTAVVTLNEDGTLAGTASEKEVSFGFGKIGFDVSDLDGAKEKTFTYQVTETTGAIPGITYSANTAVLTIVLRDNGNGILTATPTFTDTTFTNVYSSELNYSALSGFDIGKTLNGRDQEKDQFTFTVMPLDSGSVNAKEAAEKLGIDKNGYRVNSKGASEGVEALAATLPESGESTFTQADVGKVYTYQVTEADEEAAHPGYTYDKNVYTVTIETADDAENAVLTVTTTVKDEAGSVVSSQSVKTGDMVRAKAKVSFVNEYQNTPATLGGEGNVKINAEKALANRELIDGEFTFNVYDNQSSLVTSGTNDADGNITFAPVTYTTDKLNEDVDNGIATVDKSAEDGSYVYEYVYTVSEAVPDAATGVTGVATTFTITVRVTDDGKGTLDIEVVYPQDSDDILTFKNVYGASETAEAVIIGQKELAKANSEQGLTLADIAGKYSFTIRGDGPLPANTTVQNDASGNISFGTIIYTMEEVFGDTGDVLAETQSEVRTKTYTYTITEEGTLPGVTNDTEVKTVTVTITDNGDGTITPIVSEVGNGVNFKFTNTYSASGTSGITDALEIGKVLKGRDMEAGEFTFVLAEKTEDGETIVSSGTNEAAENGETGAVTFAPVTFTKPGTYQYVVREEKTGTTENGVQYNPAGTEFKVTAVVTDNKDGTLSVEWSAETQEAMVFTNVYKPEPTSVTIGASKLLDGRTLKAGEFTFEMKQKGSDEATEAVQAKNDEQGLITFGTQTYDKAGTYVYQIYEVLPKDDDSKTDGIQKDNVTYDERVYEITVTVTDNKKGTLTASVEGDALVFKNIYTEPKQPEEPKKEEPKSPGTVQTGDKTGIGIVVGTLAASTTVILASAIIMVRRRKRRK